MLPLGFIDPPQSAQQFVSLISDAFGRALRPPESASMVGRPRIILSDSDDDENYPALRDLLIDLSNASIDIAALPPRPQPRKDRVPGPSVNRFRLYSHPLRYEQIKLDLDLDASDVRFTFDRDQSGELLLMLDHAGSGRLQVSIRRHDLEQALLHAAQSATRVQGIAIKQVTLMMQQPAGHDGPIMFDAQITASKFIMTAVIRIRGRLDIDPQLNARLSDLQCLGDGVLGSLVCGFVRPRLQQANNRVISLTHSTVLPLGDVKLRNIKVYAGESLDITAEFASADDTALS